MSKVQCAESIGTAGLATVVVGSGIMGERLAREHNPVLPPGTRNVVNERVTGLIACPRHESTL